MKLRIGYELDYDFPQPTPVILMLNVHFSRVSDLAEPDHIRIKPSFPSVPTGTASATGALACWHHRG